MSPSLMFVVSPLATVASAQISEWNFVVPALQVFAPSDALQFDELSMMMSTLGLSTVALPPAKISMSSAWAVPRASVASDAASVFIILMSTPSNAGREGLGHGHPHRDALADEGLGAGHVVLGRGGDFPDGVRAGGRGRDLADDRAAEACAVVRVG